MLRCTNDTEVGWIGRSDAVTSKSVVVEVSKKVVKFGRQQAGQYQESLHLPSL